MKNKKKYLFILLIINIQIFAFGQIDSVIEYQHYGPDYSETIYPANDSLTYNQYVGETIAGYTLADGWRRDTINGGFNKEIYWNPYIKSLSFYKQDGDELIAYKYKEGKLVNGPIADTLTVSFTPNKIKGYLYGNPYYESVDVTIIIRATFERGVIQGKAVLCGIVPQYGMYNNIPLSQCFFEDGEIVGVVKYWDLNSVDFTVNDGKIRSYDEEHDYFEFKKLLELSEITYVKGSAAFTEYIIYKRNEKTGEVKAEKQ